MDIHQGCPIYCFNCGNIHFDLFSRSTLDCFFITIRYGGRTITLGEFRGQTLTISPSRSQSDNLRDSIWKGFESIMNANQAERRRLAENKYQKGLLKSQAPLPWLCWTAPNGEQGQTRKKENFLALWDRILEGEGYPQKHVLLSTTLLERE